MNTLPWNQQNHTLMSVGATGALGANRAYSIKTDLTAYWGVHTQIYTVGASAKDSRTRSTLRMSTRMDKHTHSSWRTAGVRLIFQKSQEFSAGMSMNNKMKTWLESTDGQYQNLIWPMMVKPFAVFLLFLPSCWQRPLHCLSIIRSEPGMSREPIIWYQVNAKLLKARWFFFFFIAVWYWGCNCSGPDRDIGTAYTPTSILGCSKMAKDREERHAADGEESSCSDSYTSTCWK